MTAPVPVSQDALPELLRHKALAVRLQLDAFDRELALAQAHARLAVLEREAFKAGLPAVEAELLAALQAPEGATFDWTTLAIHPPPAAA